MIGKKPCFQWAAMLHPNRWTNVLRMASWPSAHSNPSVLPAICNPSFNLTTRNYPAEGHRFPSSILPARRTSPNIAIHQTPRLLRVRHCHCPEGVAREGFVHWTNIEIVAHLPLDFIASTVWRSVIELEGTLRRPWQSLEPVADGDNGRIHNKILGPQDNCIDGTLAYVLVPLFVPYVFVHFVLARTVVPHTQNTYT